MTVRNGISVAISKLHLHFTVCNWVIQSLLVFFMSGTTEKGEAATLIRTTRDFTEDLPFIITNQVNLVHNFITRGS